MMSSTTSMSLSFFHMARQALRAVAGVALAAALGACGGGGGSSGDSVFDPGGGGGGTTPSTLTDLAVVADKTSVPNSGAEVVTVTVTALGSGNAALTGVTTPVTVEVGSGAVVTATSKTTSATDGKMTATVSLVDKTSRTVQVSVSSGSIKKTVSFEVVDSVTGGKVADLSLVLDKATVPNNGSEVAKLTVTSLDASRAVAGGSPVSFKVSDPAGSAFVTPSATSTNATTGQLDATIAIGSNRSNRNIVVTATSGTVVRTVALDVVDAAAVVPKANDLTMTLSKASIGNSGSEAVDVVVTAVDASRNAVSGITMTFSVDSNAVLVPGNLTTGADGTARASVTIGADRSNRTITITATSGTLQRKAAFKVTGAKLQATLQPATLKVGDAGQVEYTLTDVNANAMADTAVTVSGPGTSTGSGTTDSRGKFVYNYVASGSGPTAIKASAGGASVDSTVQIDAALAVVPDDVTIASATFTASPVVVSVNAVGAKDNRSELRLLFLSDKNVPVPNVRARIGLGSNAAGTDGDISSGKDAVITSDANGLAVTSFIAGQRASSTDQVKVYACFAKNDTVEQISACPATRLRTVSLTVVEQPVSISIGTNGAVGTGLTNLTYTQDFTVLVVDAAGAPKSDVQLAPVIDLVTFRKGYYVYNDADNRWVRVETAICPNEDYLPTGYRNGTIETGEDRNSNGQLDPRKSDVSIAMVGSTKTDANGLAVLRVEYPQSMGSWIEFSIRVSASGVVSPPAWTGRLADPGYGLDLTRLSGTPRVLLVPITAIQSEATPAFELSPYGISASCTSAN